MVFGTTATTYTARGIASATSRARQAGTVLMVTSDTGGNLATRAIGAAGTGATSFGANSLAVGPGDSAFGQNATVLSDNGTAVGQGAFVAAQSLNATALGQGAQATANNATALGQGSSATHTNAIALGQGVQTARANQVAIGNSANTTTVAGITSQASRTAQSGATEIVTSDGAGNLATDGGATAASIGWNTTSIAANTASIRRLDGRIDENRDGVAMAMAMGGSYLPRQGETIRFSGNLGTYNGSNALSLSGAVRVASKNVYLTGSIGVGLNGSNEVGGRGGISIGW
jgi:hypothetical protein